MKSELLREQAFLVTGDYPSIDDRRARRLLEFFGVGYETRKATDFRLLENNPAGNNGSYRLVCGAQAFIQLGHLQNLSPDSNGFGRQIHSVFLYSNSDPVSVAKVLNRLCGANNSIRRGAGSDPEWCIADDPDGMCGAMRGLHVRPAAATLRGGDFFHHDGSPWTPLIAAGGKAAFLKLTWRGIPLFVSSLQLIDIDADLTTRNFDVRDHLFQLYRLFPTSGGHFLTAHGMHLKQVPVWLLMILC